MESLARYVIIQCRDPFDCGSYTYMCWHGGSSHMLHIHSADGEEVDVRTLSQDRDLSPSEVLVAMARWWQDMVNEDRE